MFCVAVVNDVASLERGSSFDVRQSTSSALDERTVDLSDRSPDRKHVDAPGRGRRCPSADQAGQDHQGERTISEEWTVVDAGARRKAGRRRRQGVVLFDSAADRSLGAEEFSRTRSWEGHDGWPSKVTQRLRDDGSRLGRRRRTKVEQKATDIDDAR